MRERDDSSRIIRAGGIEARLFRSPRRTVSLHVEPDLSLVVKAPDSVSTAFIEDFLERRSGWARRQLERMRRIRAVAPIWANGGHVPFLGRNVPIVVTAAGRSRASLNGGFFHVSARDPDNTDEVRAAIERLFVREATERFPVRLEACMNEASRYRLPKPRLRIRTMRGRWGSCDTNKLVITLNSRLLRFRIEVVDCVIMHELAHLKYRRHGPRFYGLLGNLCPEYKEIQSELSEVFLE
jgi:hypothetical protein